MAQTLEETATATFQTHTAWVLGCAISPDGTLVATGSNDFSLCVTNLATRAKLYTVECVSEVYDVTWSPNGDRLVAVTWGGNVIQVTNNTAHSTVFNNSRALHGCAFSSSGILAVGGFDNTVTLLDPSNNYAVLEKMTGLGSAVRRLAFSPNGKTLAAGCGGGHMYIYEMTNGKWEQAMYSKYHSSIIWSLCFSPSGGMLLATSADKTASIWNVPSGTKWSYTPHVTFREHTSDVRGGAFLGDESRVITGSADGYLRIWRTSDGVQATWYYDRYDYSLRIASSLSYHAASGNIVVGHNDGKMGLWQTAAYVPSDVSIALPSHGCVRARLRIAQAQVDAIDVLLGQAENGSRQQISGEPELKSSIDDLEANKLASEKKSQEELKTAEDNAKLDALSKKRMERRNELLGIIHVCTQTLDSLADCLSFSGMEDLRGPNFRQWLRDIGMCNLQTALTNVNGRTLTMLNVDNVIDYEVTFNDAAALQLRAYMAHYKLGDDSSFSPPRGTVLSWTVEQTASWIRSLGDPYACLVSAGWHGAALCSLLPPHVVKASEGALEVTGAIKFLTLLKAQRSEMDGDKEKWMSKWSGANTIEIQAV